MSPRPRRRSGSSIGSPVTRMGLERLRERSRAGTGARVGADRRPGAFDDRPGRHARSARIRRRRARLGTSRAATGFTRCSPTRDQTSEALAGELRPGNAGANTAADQIAVAEQAIQQIPAEHIENIELLLRVDSAGASHELLDWCREGRIELLRRLRTDRGECAPRSSKSPTAPGFRRSSRTAARAPTGRSVRSPATSTCRAGRPGQG